MKSGSRLAVHAVAPDRAHQVHAERVAAEREEEPVAERQDPGVAPDEIERDGEHRVAHDLADERDPERRHVQRVVGRERQMERGQDDDRDQREGAEREPAARSIEPEESRGRAHGTRRSGDRGIGCDRVHASALRPFSANRPCGRLWMKTMMNTSTAIFASTAPANGSRNLLTLAQPERGDDRAGELPDAAEHHDHERIHDVALAEVGADVADLRERHAAETRDPAAEREGEHVDPRRSARRRSRPSRGSA